MKDLLDTAKYKTGPYHFVLYRNDPGLKWLMDYNTSWLIRNLNGGTIVDIGSGEGLYAKNLLGKGYSVDPIDLNEIAVALGRIKDVDVRYLDVHNLSKSYTTALLIHAFEHFEKPEKVVEVLTNRIRKSILMINPTLHSDHHFDEYTIEKIMHLFGKWWSLASYERKHDSEYVKLVRKEDTNGDLQNRSLLRFENLFVGRKAIIFSPGPSIKKYKKLEDEQDCITIGVKQAISYRKDYDFYLFGDKNDRSIAYESDIHLSKAVKLALCQVNKRDCFSLYSTYDAVNKFGAIPVNLRGMKGSQYSYDIARESYRQGTTTHAAINFALFCGIRDIRLVGCDSSVSLDLNVQDDRPSGHHKNIWQKFDEFFDVEYTFVNPVNVFTKRYKTICQ